MIDDSPHNFCRKDSKTEETIRNNNGEMAEVELFEKLWGKTLENGCWVKRMNLRWLAGEIS